MRAQAQAESSWRQSMTGDWTTNGNYCAPGHGLGVDGRRGKCPESWGILQVRYRFFRTAFPDAVQSTAFNADTAYAVWRACYEGYEWWLSDYSARGHTYKAGTLGAASDGGTPGAGTTIWPSDTSTASSGSPRDAGLPLTHSRTPPQKGMQ